MQCAVMIYDSAHYVINFVVPLLGRLQWNKES